MENKIERIALGGGCFWCVEAAFTGVPGAAKATSGYAGGAWANPGYEEVCGGHTGHAEVVLVEYDPTQTSLEELLDVFFAAHDPTTLNRQGADVGTQYRSIILYTSKDQKARVDSYIKRIAADYRKPVVTQVKPLGEFYPAEEYHQRYYEKYPRLPYCEAVIAPKLKKVRKKLEQTRGWPTPEVG
jgi:methionine-S-sulfoxide reductase